ncbi:MAG TPA: TlpA disulfide reductase family protein [Capsulimonadaceae bacterium]|nr:TlpA disulfide reductase family protein [Capsulimonadaceae bacterium]
MFRKLILTGLVAAVAFGSVVTDVQTAMSRGGFPLAEAILTSYKSQHGTSPEYLEALSWLARGDLITRQFDKADANARETERLAVQALASRPLDAEPHLPLALGAAIEVEAQVLTANGDRTGALALLRQDLLKYGKTSIRTRIQKNVNLLTLEGRPSPALQETEFLGPKPVPLTALRGKPVLLFFWAHWCPDCKQEEHILAEIEREYGSKGLVMIAPTQRYGYAANGDEASPADELKYIEQIRHQYYADLLSVPAPVSEANFRNYGASTTPTLVLIDRHGIVRLYHPGAMTIDELRAALNKLG